MTRDPFWAFIGGLCFGLAGGIWLEIALKSVGL